ncbi:helix-turn-helix transcriptional regulator [Streptomyces marincola]|uniref:Transcriptional regulator n=1 Tax=Streptomyces marincola TaxID=2878388 RepID=A0A1W7CYS9_9ACTN|nr:WYL domain-containing protein [Streptomyces marincola]ARQ69867.1 transcriptional regulator [Streptomyces marincola]
MTPDRFFSLLVALRASATTTTADLAALLGVSVRTVLRDLAWLQEAGFPVLVRRGRAGGVALLPGGALDTTRLTPAERDQLALYGLDDRQRDLLGASADNRRVRAKVAPRRTMRDDLLPLSAVVTADNEPWCGRRAEGVAPAALVADLRRGVRLRVRYRRSEEPDAAWRLVDPYGLLAKGGRWYLVADRAGAARLYALERVTDWRPTRVPRRLRPGATLPGVAAELTSRVPEAADGIRVRALLDARQLDRAARMLGARLTVHGRTGADGARAEITFACRVLDDVRQLLPFAGDLTVTHPAQARDHVRRLAAELVRHHA